MVRYVLFRTAVMAAAGYLWQDPGDTIEVQVNLDLVERLGDAVRQSLGGASRGMEIGGLLLGRPLPDHERAVLVEDFELWPCQHLRGLSYTLSTGERQAVGARLKRRRNSTIVGFFRSHTRPGLFLDQDDFVLFSQYFADPSQVFLLIKPSADGSATGGFFFWEDGDINRRAPYRQFPFDYRRLGGAPRLAPVPVPPPAPRPARKMPPVSSLIVPAIAALFLIAALFVSPRDSKTMPVPAKPSPPIETLLPEPVAQPSDEAKAIAPEPQLPAALPVSAPTPVSARPVRAKKAAVTVPPPPLRAVAHPRQLEAPPVLAVSMPAGSLTPVLPQSAAPPPMEAEVTYEAPHAGVLRRAFRKIAAEDYVPPSPVHQVSPVNPGGTGTVDVKVFIDASGSVTRAQALTKGSDLSGAAVAAAQKWQFTPARKHDKPAPSEMVLHFHF